MVSKSFRLLLIFDYIITQYYHKNTFNEIIGFNLSAGGSESQRNANHINAILVRCQLRNPIRVENVFRMTHASISVISHTNA